MTIKAVIPMLTRIGQVVYSLAGGQDPAVYSLFSVSTGREEGLLRVIAELDHEAGALYQIEVEAQDRASSGSEHTARATVLVRVLDR